MARNTYLKEHLSFTQAGLELLSEEAQDGSGHKTLKLKPIHFGEGMPLIYLEIKLNLEEHRI